LHGFRLFQHPFSSQELAAAALILENEIGRGTHRRAIVSLSRLLENVAKVSGDGGRAMTLVPNRGELPDLQTLLVSVTDRIATVTLNRPRFLNAVNRLMTAELERVVEWLAGHLEDVRVVMLAGAGEAFCAGDDVIELPSLTPAEARDLSLRQANIYLAFERLPQPIVAVVNGAAFGAGCVAAISCDFRLASHAVSVAALLGASFAGPGGQSACALIAAKEGTRRRANRNA
jgi:enoyl-CoA hydratase